MRFATTCFCALLIVACGSSSPPANGDLASPEDMVLAATDMASAADLKMGSTACHTVGCRAFSSNCATTGCTCIAVIADNPDPTCMGATMSCPTDPCDGKSATCNHGTGACVIQ